MRLPIEWIETSLQIGGIIQKELQYAEYLKAMASIFLKTYNRILTNEEKDLLSNPPHDAETDNLELLDDFHRIFQGVWNEVFHWAEFLNLLYVMLGSPRGQRNLGHLSLYLDRMSQFDALDPDYGIQLMAIKATEALRALPENVLDRLESLLLRFNNLMYEINYEIATNHNRRRAYIKILSAKQILMKNDDYIKFIRRPLPVGFIAADVPLATKWNRWLLEWNSVSQRLMKTSEAIVKFPPDRQTLLDWRDSKTNDPVLIRLAEFELTRQNKIAYNKPSK